MLLSISSSKHVDARRGVLMLIIVLALLCVGLEVAATFGYPRVSRIQHRVQTDYAKALRIRAADSEGRTGLLIAGNSLMLAGVDMNRLRAELGDRFQVNG